MSLFKIFLLIIASTLILGCSSEKITPSETDESEGYFPVEAGDSALFKIEMTSFTILGEEFTSFIQKEVVESYDNDYAIVSVFRYDSLTANFIKTSNYSIDTKELRYITNKNSLRKVEAVFPFTEGTTFNENEFNQLGGSVLTISDVNTTLSIPDEESNIENALKVSSPKVFNNIEKNEFLRIYQKGTGLVYELDQEIETQPGQNPIGFKHIKTRINF